MIKVVIVTGVYGSGKSLTLYTFEEAGYYTIDNLPLDVAKPFFDSLVEKKNHENVAIAVPLEDANDIYAIAKKYPQFALNFLGITCSRETLNERFRLSRKLHPLQSKGYTLDDALKRDYSILETVRENLTNFIDTTRLDKKQFAKVIQNTIMGIKGDKFSVMFMSFGYKKSVPQDIETVFDVRLLPNPYWVNELKDMDGLDQPIIDYVLSSEVTKEFLKHIISYLEYYLEKLKNDGKGHANIGIACSGGQHRSVVIAEYLGKYFSKKYQVYVSHRDI